MPRVKIPRQDLGSLQGEQPPELLLQEGLPWCLPVQRVSYSNHADICPRFLLNFAMWALGWEWVGGNGKGRSADVTTPSLHPWIQGNWRKRKKISGSIHHRYLPFPELDSPCTEETVPVSFTGGSKGVKLFIIAEHIKFTWLQFLAHKVDPKVSKGSQKTRGRGD